MPILFFVFLTTMSLFGGLQTAPPPIIGRWDITIQRPDGDR